MEVRPGANPADVKNYDTDRLRHDFLIQNLFVADEIKTIYKMCIRDRSEAAELFVLCTKLVSVEKLLEQK